MPKQKDKPPGNQKRNRRPQPKQLWQMDDPDFERNHWWPKKEPGEHRELVPFGSKGRSTERTAPVVWEVLRRHDQIPLIRREIAKYVNLPAQALDPVLLRHGFGIEFLLAKCGLNAWVSSKLHENEPSLGFTPGLHPLDRFGKWTFESLMPAYAFGTKPTMEWTTSIRVDLLAEARSLADVLRDSNQCVAHIQDQFNPLFPLLSDPYELLALSMLMQDHAKEPDRQIVMEVRGTRRPPAIHPTLAVDPWDDGAYLHFCYEDFSYIDCFATQLGGRKDGVSRFLWDGMPDFIRRALRNFENKLDRDSEAEDLVEDWESAQQCAAVLATFLNSIIVGDSIYERKRFSKVTLTSETETLLAKPQSAVNQVELNRRLLEAAYPEYIRKAEPGRRTWAFGELLNPAMTPSTSKPPPERRPRREQLQWIRDVESGDPDRRPDYDRVMERIRFPLLPAESDPQLCDTLEKRLERVKDDLRDSVREQKRRLAKFYKAVQDSRPKNSRG
jgi:hypothetical protein